MRPLPASPRSRERLLALGLGAAAAGLVTGGAGYAARELLHRQAETARRLIGKPLGEQAPYADRTWKKKYGDPLHLLLLGDSIAAGLGADLPKETLGARLATRLAKATHRSVRLTTGARVGSESSMLADQVAASLDPADPPDVAVVVVGGNDVTHRVPVAESVAHLVETVVVLRAHGVVVVVGTCPDLGALRPVPQPLRSLGALASRQLAAAQAGAAAASGAHVVSLADVVGPFFVTNPDEMFSLDRFHPSALGYKRTARAILPSVLAALGLEEEVPFGHRVPVPPDQRAGANGPNGRDAGGAGR
ncbi:MAG: SGNH/GDSL hydrolase family protein [Nocardioides sp.]